MPKGETVADYAALSLEEVLEEYESLISDERKHETNLKRETFRAAMALSERYAKLEMGRKVLKYCDAALESVAMRRDEQAGVCAHRVTKSEESTAQQSSIRTRTGAQLTAEGNWLQCA